jgi:Tol biopolymer transport system component
MGGRYSAVSGDGRWIAYVGDDLVRADHNGDWDVYVRKLSTGRTELVSRDNRGRQTRGAFDDVDVSFDGDRVAYVVNGALFVYDRSNDRRVRADVNDRGRPAAHSFPFGPVSLSGNGRAVAFASTAANLSSEDENGRPDVYVRDLRSATTELVSAGPDGRAPEGDADSWSVSISRSGRFVAFGSEAPLLDSDGDDAFDVYVRDRVEAVTLLASEGCAGSSGHPSLSNDGQWVAFVSEECGGPGMLFARGPLLEP